jgi:hypothetical protein
MSLLIAIALESVTAASGFTLGALVYGQVPGPPGSDEQPTREREQQLAIEDWRAVTASFRRALSACENLPSRLRGLADTAAALAITSRRAHSVGLVPKPGRVNPDWDAPWELRARNPRVGPAAAWQPLDRSFAALTAVLDAADASLADHASVCEALSTAARQLADVLDAGSLQELATCSFCGKLATEVDKVIAGPGPFICDERVALCGEILNDGS